MDLLAETAANARTWLDRPLVTVIIPVFNKWALTRTCLRSVLFSESSLPLQIVVVDDCSTDETAQELQRFPHVEVVRNEANCGFIRSCNRGAAAARGTYLLFLNNDTVVEPRAIAALVDRIESDDRIGIAGSKLIYPDGRLQEAGGIIWSDARGWNYGRGDHADCYKYNFVRDVDYVSGAALLVRAGLFQSLGGFDARFAPAYYEDTDLCFAARAAGHRVVYEPASVVIHHEGASSGTDPSSGAKRFEAINRHAFLEKWKDVLQGGGYFEPDANNVEAAARARGEYSSAVLIVEEAVPRHDRESGGERLRLLMLGLAASGTRVVLYPDNLKALEPYTSDLQSHGIEVVYAERENPKRWREYLAAALAGVDVAWICRPVLFRSYRPAIGEISDVPAIYDSIDLHYLRLKREAEIEGRPNDRTWPEIEALEVACGLAADATIVVSEIERELLGVSGVSPIYVVSNVHELREAKARNYFLSEGILFIGGYSHVPNIDAVRWLVREIMPQVWSEIPDAGVTLLGSDPPLSVRELAGKRVHVTGYISDVSAYFRRARVFAAPIRYGAGVKGKIGQALSYRLPVVTTSIGAEGFNFRPGIDAMIADDTASFAAAIVALYNEPDAWSAMSYRAARSLEPFSAVSAVREVRRVISEAGAP